MIGKKKYTYINSKIKNIIKESYYVNHKNIFKYTSIFPLYEEYHILHTFDLCIEYLQSFILNNKDKKGLIYTGWNWNMLLKKCILCNDENKGYGIYIKYFNNQYDELYMYVSERDFNNTKIIININLYLLDSIDLSYWLSHEFLHIRQLFALPNRNILLSRKNIGNNVNMDNPKLLKYEDNIKQLLYYISPTEQEARLLSLYRFILHNNYNDINEIIEKSSKYTLIKNYKLFYNKLSDLLDYNQPTIYKTILVLGYYLYTYNLFKKKITLDFLTYTFSELDNNDILLLCYDILNFINDNLSHYEIQIIKVIKKVLNDKNLSDKIENINKY